jgi:hypothetical protein
MERETDRTHGVNCYKYKLLKPKYHLVLLSHVYTWRSYFIIALEYMPFGYFGVFIALL